MTVFMHVNEMRNPNNQNALNEVVCVYFLNSSQIKRTSQFRESPYSLVFGICPVTPNKLREGFYSIPSSIQPMART